jgi:hypothetical protein
LYEVVNIGVSWCCGFVNRLVDVDSKWWSCLVSGDLEAVRAAAC